MVFSNTALRTHSILKVVEVDRVKTEKRQVENVMLSAPAQTPASMTEGLILKSEPTCESTMFQGSDYEFFQDLGFWGFPGKEDLTTTIDAPATQERAQHTTTLYTQFPAYSGDGYEANSPHAQSSFYTSTPQAMSPNTEWTGLDLPKALGTNEDCLDINSLPIDIAQENTDIHMPFEQDTLDYDSKYTWIDMLQTSERMDYINPASMMVVAPNKLILDVSQRASAVVDDINTPDVLEVVEQLENEKLDQPDYFMKTFEESQYETTVSLNTPVNTFAESVEYEPVTPKTESYLSDYDDSKSHSSAKKRRRNSEDSDESYNPYQEKIVQKYKRRKNIPLKEMIEILETKQQNKARRGRPPKRRDSIVSACSVEDPTTTHEHKYRELRDKNNVASKRSRMNRKLKELQMEKKADDLEERNKKLKVRAELLEIMTKKLKAALMAAVMPK